MGDKKHIDKFFQEQFRDFEAKPPQHIWENINSELEKENHKQKRMVPFWVQFSGVAASLIFLITVGILQFTTDDSINDSIVDDQIIIGNNKSESIAIDSSINVEQSVTKNQSDVVTGRQNNKNIASEKQQEYTSSNSTLNNSIANKINSEELINDVYDQELVAENPVMTQKSEGDLKSSDVESFYPVVANKNQSEVNNNTLVENRTLNKSNIDDMLVKNQSHQNNNITDKNTLTVAKTDFHNDNIENVDKNKQFVDDLVVKEDKNQIIKHDNFSNDDVLQLGFLADKNSAEVNTNSKLPSNNSINGDITKEGSNVVVHSENSNLQNQVKKGLLVDKSIANVNSDTVNSDNISKTIDPLNIGENVNINEEAVVADDNCVDEDEIIEELPVEKTIEEAIAEQEQKEDEETDNEIDAYKKWKIAPNVAPVYYNSLTSGSPIDDDFAGNTKKGQFTTSYGIGVGYALNKRLSVRTGINKLEVGYDTQDVAIYSSPETSGGHNYKNINFSSEGAGMSIAGSGTYSAAQIPSSFSSLFDSSLNQRFGYLEVPLELSYKLSDKKLRVDVIAGISTFFLNKNEIYSENKVKTTYIGEANNLNNMSYSTNLGIGLEYKLSKSLNFNFDPMFKYQLNAFSNDAGNFKPYILGIYSGLSYRF